MTMRSLRRELHGAPVHEDWIGGDEWMPTLRLADRTWQVEGEDLGWACTMRAARADVATVTGTHPGALVTLDISITAPAVQPGIADEHGCRFAHAALLQVLDALPLPARNRQALRNLVERASLRPRGDQ